MLTSKEILNFIKINKLFFEKEYHVVRIGLFGSFARNEQNNNSDIDILIELQDNTHNIFHIKRNLKEYFKTNLNREIDICREKALHPIFKDKIISETIYV